ncbi:MAG: hypothetical protein ACTMHL_05665 [Janibacter sp.]
MHKFWMTYVNAHRPTADRHKDAGQDADHQRTAGELSAMSRDEARGTRRERAAQRRLASAATTDPTYHAPYDAGMSDRFFPTLSTR